LKKLDYAKIDAAVKARAGKRPSAIASEVAVELGISPSSVQKAIKRIKNEIEIVPVTADRAIPTSTEALPRTEKDFDNWVKWNIASPERRAMRLMQLEQIASGSGIAAIQAMKQLNDFTAQYAIQEGVSEAITYNVYQSEEEEAESK
jgi:hypothetical protein